MKLEHKQVQQHSTVTTPFLTDIVNPPNQLKHKNLTKTLDVDKWKRGLCNKIGRIAQGYKDTKGRNEAG